ncbi:hypothetical protein B0H14DRAFT_2753055 [Mycena olivaceomarginata]|nr:hypothetical protein B0H14DRAFT_2753055 [Mycena olivaceomarginata]
MAAALPSGDRVGRQSAYQAISDNAFSAVISTICSSFPNLNWQREFDPVEEIFDYDDARLFWRSPVWKVLLDEDTPDALHMSNRERVYYVVSLSSCDLSMDGRKYTFGIGKTCSLDSLRGQLSQHPEIRSGFRLHYNGEEIGVPDRPSII